MTALNEVIATSLSEVRNINAHIVAMQEQAKAARKSAIEPFLDALAASGEVSLIVVYGYTPGFNDGEPCEHSADFYVNIEQAKDEDLFDRDLDLNIGDWTGELEDLRTWERATGRFNDNPGAFERNVALCAKHGHVYKAPSKTIRDAIRDVVFNTMEEENDTNYFVTYVLNDGKFEVNTGEYDCGY